MSNTQGDYQAAEGIDISRRIHVMLWERKQTQTAVAKYLHIDQSTLSKKIKGDVGWSISDLMGIARIFETTVAYLIGETDVVENPKRPRQDSNLRPRDYKGVLSRLRILPENA